MTLPDPAGAAAWPAERLCASTDLLEKGRAVVFDEPASGHCVGGPCGRGRLSKIDGTEQGGEVYWQPTRDTRPAPPEAIG